MLLEDIKSFSVVLPDLMEFIKKRGYDVTHFFMKLDLSMQYIIIQEFLFTQYNIVMLVTPEVIGIKVWKEPYGYPNDPNTELIYAERVLDIKTNLNHCYTKLIVKAFEYIQKTPF